MKVDLGDQGAFNYRAAALCLHGGRVLLHRDKRGLHWALPGGHIDPQETAAQALTRELQEELGLRLEVGRLVWISEHFYTGRMFKQEGKRVHELCWYFECTLPPDDPIVERVGLFDGLEGPRYKFMWQPLDQLGQLRVLPTFVARGLRDLPQQVTHIVSRE